MCKCCRVSRRMSELAGMSCLVVTPSILWPFSPRDSALTRFLLLPPLSRKYLYLLHIHLPNVPKILPQSFSSIQPMMVSSSTALSSGQHPLPDLGDLHHFVMGVAANHVDIPKIPSAFIGPARPTSTYLGEETVLAGPSSETAVPIMFRCVWGPGNHSRHVLVRMKPSVSEQALGLRLCQRLDIPTTGAVTIEPVIKWIPGLMPYTSGIDKGKPLSNNPLVTVPRANWLLVLLFAEVVQALGSSLSGIVDLDLLICDR